MLEQGPAASAPGPQAAQRAPFNPRCLCIDLEVGINDARIHAFAAIRGDTGASCRFSGGDLSTALRELDQLAEGASFLLGHNIVAFDLPHLAAADPGLSLLRLPAVDTLRINPLAFPRNPYHHLVKHYQDGQLRSGQRNNPLLDARRKPGPCVSVIASRQLHRRGAQPACQSPARRWISAPVAGDRRCTDFRSADRRNIDRRADGVSGLSPDGVRKALYDLEALGIASNDTALTAFVHSGVENSSRKRFEEATALEVALVELMREAAPDLAVGETTLLHLRHATQRLKDAGHKGALPEKLVRLVKSLANDGRGEEGAGGSLSLRTLDPETVQVTLQREWSRLEKMARLRRAGGLLLLEHLLRCLAPAQRGNDLLAETTLGKLTATLQEDLALKAEVRDLTRLLDRALLWLHEQEIVRLNKGLAVFRPAMTIRLAREKRSFAKADFQPLKLHYDEQVLQVHVMAEYAQRGLAAMAEALRLALDYFALGQDEFLSRWLPKREKELARQTTPASWRRIVEALNNPQQQQIVTDDREQTNVLVLAGPGSGKTRVLVHRIAYLVRVRRESPRGILALAYNRHAAVEIRGRLAELIGDDATGVTVLTCNALAMRLAGVTFVDRATQVGNDVFRAVLNEAVALLNGTGLPPEEADGQRERLLAGFRWILVDEYQDIGPEQYELISALAGRTRQDEDGRLSLFAVGDDDQNMYAFNGASVEFIRRFADDYAAKPAFLVENYRSTQNIIASANEVIGTAANRMKQGHPIAVDRRRAKDKTGGRWEHLDPVGKGRVQVVPAGPDKITQAIATMEELTRLASLDPHWSWRSAAVIAREWHLLDPVRSWCELNEVPVQVADESPPHFWRLRETQALLDWLDGRPTRIVSAGAIKGWLDESRKSVWWDALREVAAEYDVETGGAQLPLDHFKEWLAEWGREARRRQNGLLLLTAHRAKGLEFDHVAVLDGGWEKVGPEEDRDAPRRLSAPSATSCSRLPQAIASHTLA